MFVTARDGNSKFRQSRLHYWRLPDNTQILKSPFPKQGHRPGLYSKM
jgi:hypothetical protein